MHGTAEDLHKSLEARLFHPADSPIHQAFMPNSYIAGQGNEQSRDAIARLLHQGQGVTDLGQYMHRMLGLQNQTHTLRQHVGQLAGLGEGGDIDALSRLHLLISRFRGTPHAVDLAHTIAPNLKLRELLGHMHTQEDRQDRPMHATDEDYYSL